MEIARLRLRYGAGSSPIGRGFAILGWGIAVGASATVVSEIVSLAQTDWAQQFAFGNGDLNGYLDGARRFFATGTPYAPAQLAGSWQLSPHSFIHPPLA